MSYLKTIARSRSNEANDSGSFPSMKHLENYIEVQEASLAIAENVPNWPGTSHYLQSLSKAIHQALKGKISGRKALINAQASWCEIKDDFGSDLQKFYYKKFT